MTTREEIARELNRLSSTQLEQVAQYLAFLQYQSRLEAARAIDESKLAALYAEFADEDQALAEAGMEEYAARLAKEDAASILVE